MIGLIGKGTQCDKLVQEFNFVHLSGERTSLLLVPTHADILQPEISCALSRSARAQNFKN